MEEAGRVESGTETECNAMFQRYHQSSGWNLFAVGLAFVASVGYGMPTVWNSSQTDHISDTKKSELVMAIQ